MAPSRLQQLQQMQQFETQQQPQQEISQQSSKSPVQSQSQQQLQQTTNNINRKLNGFLNLKTPLIGYVLTVQWLIWERVYVFLLWSVHRSQSVLNPSASKLPPLPYPRLPRSPKVHASWKHITIWHKDTGSHMNTHTNKITQ